MSLRGVKAFSREDEVRGGCRRTPRQSVIYILDKTEESDNIRNRIPMKYDLFGSINLNKYGHEAKSPKI